MQNQTKLESGVESVKAGTELLKSGAGDIQAGMKGVDEGVEKIKKVADGAAAVSEKAANSVVQLFNDFQDIHFLTIVAIIAGTWLAIFLIRKIVPFLAEQGPNQARLYLLGSVPVIRLLLMTVAILWILPIVFNFTFENFLVIAGGASFAIGFAFKDYVSSLIAGIIAIFERPYRPGDWVEIDGDYGEVQTVGLRAIRIQTAADDIITIPHVRMWANNISNSNDGARTLMCVADFYLTPDHDAERVRAALRDVALTSAYLEYSKPVVVILNEVPFGTHYKVKAYPFDMRDQFAFISDVTVRGKSAITEAGGQETTVMYAATSENKRG